MRVDGLIFDKDGTLFDFDATWNQYTVSVISYFAQGRAAQMATIANVLGFDLSAMAYHPTSPVIAGTNRLVAELLASVVTTHDADEVERYLTQTAAQVKSVPAVPLAPYLRGLKNQGLKLAVMTNDSEFGAKSHLNDAGVSEYFEAIIGADSGYGAKPDADPLHAIAGLLSLDPAQLVMVGDSTHDLLAGKRAGMRTIGVLTGVADSTELSPYADFIFDDIGGVTDWLKTVNT
ncbi:HAD family hydrolase [Cognatishimia sp. WU-CL00825]|uniref:HAD family hydrolase n=1 Tax=Cognatishimia sp. WU-CL00825 TaxID=3127658 RepID=UPI003109F1F0